MHALLLLRLGDLPSISHFPSIHRARWPPRPRRCTTRSPFRRSGGKLGCAHYKHQIFTQRTRSCNVWERRAWLGMVREDEIYSDFPKSESLASVLLARVAWSADGQREVLSAMSPTSRKCYEARQASKDGKVCLLRRVEQIS